MIRLGCVFAFSKSFSFRGKLFFAASEKKGVSSIVIGSLCLPYSDESEATYILRYLGVTFPIILVSRQKTRDDAKL